MNRQNLMLLLFLAPIYAKLYSWTQIVVPFAVYLLATMINDFIIEPAKAKKQAKHIN